MNQMIKFVAGLAVALIGFQAHALTLTGLSLADCVIDPDCYYGPSGPPADNPSTADIEAAILAQGGPAVSLFELYKENVGDGFDSGSFASSYETFFFDTPLDPEDALITYQAGEDIITCPDCFILVKDGASIPNWYVFDIGGWNGTDNIRLMDFWTGRGAISHVSIFSSIANAPEPGILVLVAGGLLAFGLVRRKKTV